MSSLLEQIPGIAVKLSRERLAEISDFNFDLYAKTIRLPTCRVKFTSRAMNSSSLKPLTMAQIRCGSVRHKGVEVRHSLEPRSPATTTSTTLEKFVAEIFLSVYRGKASGA